MTDNLTKADKRSCRALIHIGLERECEKFVAEMKAIASKPIPLAELNESYREENGWSVEGPWHKRYIALYKKTAKFDKHVARRYDDIGGSRYLSTVLGLYCDSVLTDDDIAILSDDVRKYLVQFKKVLTEEDGR